MIHNTVENASAIGLRKTYGMYKNHLSVMMDDFSPFPCYGLPTLHFSGIPVYFYRLSRGGAAW